MMATGSSEILFKYALSRVVSFSINRKRVSLATQSQSVPSLSIGSEFDDIVPR